MEKGGVYYGFFGTSGGLLPKTNIGAVRRRGFGISLD
jgi:hypothetical protein